MWIGIALVSVILAIWTKDSMWYSCNFSFGIGMIFKAYEAVFLNSIKKHRLFWLAVLLSGFAISAVIYMTAMNKSITIYIGFKVLASIFWTCLVLCVALQRSLAHGKYIRLLGEASLECYLLHPFVLASLEKVSYPKNAEESMAIALLSIAVSVIAAYVFHVFYKKMVLQKKQ